MFMRSPVHPTAQFPVWPLWLLAALVGCPSDPPEEHVCGDLTRGMTYVQGLAVAGDDGVLSARLREASPAPPDVGDNVWRVELLDANDAPAAGCTTTLNPFMPDHGHGASAVPVWTEDAAVIGTYDLTGLDLFMPGLWEIRLEELDCGAAGSDTVVYRFCAEG